MNRARSTPLVTCWLLASALLGGVAQAAPLVPPAGYYNAVPAPEKDKSVTCPAVPEPYTGTLMFRSKYEGSDQARATLNADAEKAFRQQTKAISEMEKGLTKQVNQYLRKGQPAQLQCALSWLSRWAEADALRSKEQNHTGKSMRKWALGSLAGAYLRLKFSTSQPLAAYPQQTQVIEAWFGKLADQVVLDWSDLPPNKVNNHSYWSAWSVMASAVATNRRDLFGWAVQQFQGAAQQIDAEGFLPNELEREQRALTYHNYSLPPLTMLVAFAQANGVDLRPENHGALQRLAQRVIDGTRDPAAFARKTAKEQDTREFDDPNKFSWLEPYCALYTCPPDVLSWRQSLRPLNSFRLGGDITQLFQPATRAAASR